MAGCSDDGEDVVAGGFTTPVPSSVPATSATTTPAVFDGASTTPVSVAPGPNRALLKAVRSDHHDGFDRVVFEFENVAPGYAVKYVARPVIEDGSGRVVEVAGAAVLQVVMENASGADLLGENVRQTYTGPNRISPANTTTVEEMVRVGDFEALLTWAVGTTGEKPFKVAVLASPPRLVVDIEAPTSQ